MSEIDDQKSCCEGGDCSPPKNEKKLIKTIVFAFIILLAMVVTSYSLFFRDREAVVSDCEPGTAAKPLEEIASIPALQERLSGVDLVLLIFTETDEKLPVELSETLDKSFSLIRDETPKSEMLILSPDDSDYEKLVDYYIITGFPSIMVLGRYGEKLLVRSGITEERILQAHESVSNPPEPCCLIINAHSTSRS